MNKSIYEECVARGIAIDSHGSDLYIPYGVETRKIVKDCGVSPELIKGKDGGLWYCIPFAYLPFWEKSRKVGESVKMNQNAPITQVVE